MCGISGLLGQDASAVRAGVERMVSAQAHRGPDDQGLEIVPLGQWQAGLGHNRLAILDPSPLGRQPMTNPDTGARIVFNGEIYNYVSLREKLRGAGLSFRTTGDTEVILRAYQRWGVGAFDRLRGMFAFVLVDIERGRLILCRDALGIKPLYYAVLGEGLVFASEVRGILASGLVEPNVDRRSLATFFAYGAVQQPVCAIMGVRVVPSASWMEWDLQAADLVLGQSPARRYWNFNLAGSPNTGSLREETYERFSNAVRTHLVSDVPVGAFLSSGLDSSLIAACAARAGSRNFRTFTIAMDQTPELDEGAAASRIVARLGLPHEKLDLEEDDARKWAVMGLEAMDQPTAVGLNTFIVSKFARDCGFKVALSGVGGDELFGGYDAFQDVPLLLSRAKWFGWLPAPLRRLLARVATLNKPRIVGEKASDMAGSDLTLESIYLRRRRYLSNRQLRALGLRHEHLALSRDYLPPQGTVKWPHDGDPISEVARLEISYYLGNTLLPESDVFGMANSLEIRVPFLDRDLVEFVLSIPGTLLLPSGKADKHLLRRICRERMPEVEVPRRKRGFVLPYASWMLGPLREFAESRVAMLASSGMVEAGAVKAIWSNFLQEPRGPGWSRAWLLMVAGSFVERLRALS